MFASRFDAFVNHTVRMSPHNFGDAMLASGSIPLVVDAVRDIADAPPGWYWDGGIIDYHLHLPFNRLDGLTLYPHFAAHITPGWLDKFTPWRKARGPWLDTMVLLCPSAEFVASLPGGQIPDRGDFKRFGVNWQARETRWKAAVAQAQALADAFADIVTRQRWAEVVEPL
jgi:predicted acylesterase/phospholipase RssA